ncbi:enoyl-CoA hydratase/isomerase family protein [Nonomuraea gerenzanensis]|uniref:Enoyl-CoA hydratase n=1 Tax=Nonomuraea gerenzanensis TaxID=93944 RepID=A0A1M4EGM1_9ACTN|nr:enoyl-CoA hydratase-related protein [Nonomuraea gerenzanensis]UBU09298.1 enoyl-CoA hydratase/isomerase family protein [Nonomuraea gerenzanensis]SBO97703.1 Enoyl-CoA hydratase [Nonomuraea gerenzanensis]
MDGPVEGAAVLVERDGAVAVVTLNRPERRNALDGKTKAELRGALEDVAADAAVRAVLLTGAGGAFCAGQDLAEHAAALREDAAHAFDTVEQDYAPVVRLLATMDKPVVAGVNGTCVGAGLALALACDLRVFAEDAVLGTAFSAIGLTCDSGLSATLTRSVGEARARELVLLAEPFNAQQAVAWGISGRVVPRDEVGAAGRALAARLAAGPTAAYAESKRLIAAAWGRPLDATLAAEGQAQARLGLTADHAGAVEAFLAKRKPAFEGH